jgi:hypothetical protein
MTCLRSHQRVNTPKHLHHTHTVKSHSQVMDFTHAAFHTHTAEIALSGTAARQSRARSSATSHRNHESTTANGRAPSRRLSIRKLGSIFGHDKRARSSFGGSSNGRSSQLNAVQNSNGDDEDANDPIEDDHRSVDVESFGRVDGRSDVTTREGIGLQGMTLLLARVTFIDIISQATLGRSEDSPQVSTSRTSTRSMNLPNVSPPTLLRADSLRDSTPRDPRPTIDTPTTSPPTVLSMSTKKPRQSETRQTAQHWAMACTSISSSKDRFKVSTSRELSMVTPNTLPPMPLSTIIKKPIRKGTMRMERGAHKTQQQ